MKVISMRHVMVIVISLMVIKFHVKFILSSHLHCMPHTLLLLSYWY